MRKLIVFILLILSALQLNAQETFFRFTQGWQSKKIFEQNNTYTVVSLDATVPYENHINFMEVSDVGDSITNWTFELDTCSSTETLYSQCYSSEIDDSYYIAGTIVGEQSDRLYGFLSRFSNDLQTEIWSKSFELANQGNSFRVIQRKNDTTIILGSYNKHNDNLYTSFLEVDTSGVIRWQKNFDCSGDCNMKPFHILPTVDNGFIFTCYESHINGQPGTDDFYTAVIKTDSLGNEQWRHTWGGDTTKNIGSWVVPLDDGNYLYAWTDNEFAGYGAQNNPDRTIRFAKFDIGGNVFWYKDLGNYIQNEWYNISQMELMPDGNIIIGIDGYIQGALVKIDQDANLIWYRKLMPPGLAYEDNTASAQHMKILGVTCTSDGGFALAGEYFSSPGNMFSEVYQSAYIYKLDEYGCYEPDCHVGVNEIAEQKKGFKIMPNPASKHFEIKLDTPTVSATGQIFDLTGKVVKQFYINNSTSSINISNLQTGVFLIKVDNQTQKLIIE